ncbi:N-ethylammeline chlorohydrolase [Halobacteriales archaeon QH_8_64_26]|nr:MAG: N-ethylammeline chlorohydrolase [Halobacteriales archaeon QH_8_64_26]
MTRIVVHDAFVLTVDDRNRLFKRGTLVSEDGVIREVRKTHDGDATLDADHVIDGTGKLVLPGLVNAHAHLELTALIGAFSEFGVGELFATMTAVYNQLGRGEYDYLVKAGYELAALNFLVGGVTTTNSMDVRPTYGAEVFGEAGLRGVFGSTITDLFWDVPVDEQLQRARSFVETCHGSYGGRVRAAICPHDDWSVSRDLWERVARLADEYPTLPVHTHLLELDQSNTLARSYGAKDSLGLVEEVGLLDERLLAAHVRLADEEDIRRIANAGSGVAHCPSIFCYFNPDGSAPWTPVPELRGAGVATGLGLDDYYWHDSYDLFGEARQARLAANLKKGAKQFSSIELVRMLTIEGAEALGMDEEIGSLEPGKRADFLVLDVDKPKFTPLTNVPAQIVNNATSADVETVVVDGTVLMGEGTIPRLDTEAIRERATRAVERFCEETGWEIGIGGSDPPSTGKIVTDLPKRGPARLLARIATQSVKDELEF